MASASGIPSITRSWTSFHFAAAAGAEASLQRITNARLSGTPAASRLESRRVKFSSIRAETLLALPKESLNGDDDEGAALLLSADSFGNGFAAGLAGPFPALRSARRIGRRPRPSIWRKA